MAVMPERDYADTPAMSAPLPRSQPVPAASGLDVLALLTRIGCHVYTGELHPDGSYREVFTGPGLNLLIGGEPDSREDPSTLWNTYVHPDDFERYKSEGSDLRQKLAVAMEYRMLGKDGVVRWVLDQMWLREVAADGRRMVDGVVTDVSELHRRRRQVDEARAWLDASVTMSPAAIVVMDREWRVRLWNPAAEKLFGWPESEVRGTVAPHIPPERREAFAMLVDRMVIGGETLIEHEEVRIGQDGEQQEVAISSSAMFDENGELTGLMGLITDISARKESERRLRQLALHDPLTGLANRILVNQRIEAAVTASQPGDPGLAVLLLDLDGFKTVNDSFGHAVGDELLLAVARRLRSCLREGDIAARLGGDEFALLLERIDAKETAVVSRRVLDALSAPFSLRRGQAVVTASIGVVHASGQLGDHDLLRDADVAMYKAKADGKNRVVVFEASMQERVVTRLRLENELRAAVERGEFELYYQPYVDLDSRMIVGLEALVRWHHPTRGLLLPGEFIEVAEDTGLIVPLGQWIVRQACMQAGIWRQLDTDRPLTISVNLSPRQLYDPLFVGIAARAIADAGLPPGMLTIEITENLLLGDAALAGTRLAELRALGIHIAVDDFGTGYSSLAYLRRYPVDVLKIDRTFVHPLTDGPRQAALVRSIIDLATALDVGTVAEGVERPEQASALSTLGCHVAQGFYFARPQPAPAISRLLAVGELGVHDTLPARAQLGLSVDAM
jgi:diguanylate cyclase (GGDEF)-like protein/PAS domain S-box-containing protein